MKKLLIIILMAGISVTSARSQVLIALVFGDKLNTPNIEFGLNVGANFSKLSNYPDANTKSGLNLGLYFNFKLSDHLYLHPEMQFLNQMGTKGIDKRYLPPDFVWQDESLKTWSEMTYFTLIFLPRYKLTNQLYFEAGLYGSFLTSSNDYFRVNPDDNSELQLKNNSRDEKTHFDAGVHVGLGYKFGKGEGMNLSLRYSNGFVNTVQDAGQEAEYNKGFHVQLGIPIGVGKEDVKNQLDK